MTINSILCCENIITDLETKNISLFNLIERISVQGFPFFLPKFAVFISSENEVSGLKVEKDFKVLNNDRELFKGKMAFNFIVQPITRNILRFNGLIIPSAGILSIQILNEGETIPLKEMKILVEIMSPIIAPITAQ